VVVLMTEPLSQLNKRGKLMTEKQIEAAKATCGS